MAETRHPPSSNEIPTPEQRFLSERPTLADVIANGTAKAMWLHASRRGITIKSDEPGLVASLKEEAAAALEALRGYGLDLAAMGEQAVRFAVNVECNAAACRVLAKRKAAHHG